MKVLSSILSGILAASAGVFGKYAFQDSEDTLYTKAISAVIMLLLNSLMIKFLVQSFKDLGASKATLVNLTFNYIFSALFGFFFFYEKITNEWLIGSSIMLLGVYIITTD